jgi:3-deoxy-D-arabino-heptulosonate 7-phosphate (DAHP) synthase
MDINNIFIKLKNSNLPVITDPMGVSGAIAPCENMEDRAKSIDAINIAVERASYARSAEKEGRNSDAFYWWNRVYDDSFPPY